MSVLDASALLTLLQKEPGADVVAGQLSGGVISAVNAAEVASKLVDAGISPTFSAATIRALGLEIVAFDPAHAWEVGRIRITTRSLGLSLGDRACLALGRSLHDVVVTADRSWSELSDEFQILVVR